MKVFEYARLHKASIPPSFIQAYNLQHLFDAKDFICIEIQRVMYVLQQANRLPYNQL